MKTRGLVLSLAAFGLALADGAYFAFESGVLPASTPDRQIAVSDSAAQPLLHPALQPTATPSDRTAVSEQTDAPATEREVTALRQEVTQLRAAVADLRRYLQRPAEDRAPGTAVEQPPFDAHAQAQEEQQRREAMDMQESGFRREPVDPAWSWQTASRVDEVLASLGVDPSGVRNLECRASTCKLELGDGVLLTPEGGVPVSLAKGLPQLVTQLAGTLPNMTSFRVADGNGGTRTVFYFSRESDQPPPSGE
jgi:hypothetical protein